MRKLTTAAALAAALGALAWAIWDGWLRFNTPSNVMYPVRGIDVSHHQGTIDWQKVRAAGISFAYIKASEGADFTDPRFAENWRGAKAAGIARGAYHFFTLCTPVAPQIDNFVNAVYEVGELPPVLDLEFGGNCANPPAVADVKAMLDEVVPMATKRFGEPPIFYTTYEFRDAYLCPTCVNGSLPLLWIRDVVWKPRLTNAEPWVFWQHHNRARLEGIDGPVDLDVFRGDVAAYGRYLADRRLDIVRAH